MNEKKETIIDLWFNGMEDAETIANQVSVSLHKVCQVIINYTKLIKKQNEEKNKRK